jgi:hypothetical protein
MNAFASTFEGSQQISQVRDIARSRPRARTWVKVPLFDIKDTSPVRRWQKETRGRTLCVIYVPD